MRLIYIETGCDEMTNTLLAIESMCSFIEGEFDMEKLECAIKNSDNKLLLQALSWKTEFNHDAFLALIAGDKYSKILDIYMAKLLSYQSESFRTVICRVLTKMRNHGHEICQNIDWWQHIVEVLRYNEFTSRSNIIFLYAAIQNRERMFLMRNALVTRYSGGENASMYRRG